MVGAELEEFTLALRRRAMRQRAWERLLVIGEQKLLARQRMGWRSRACQDFCRPLNQELDQICELFGFVREEV